MALINPYLNFDGNCEEAFMFYRSVFGGEFTGLLRYKDVPDSLPIPEESPERIMYISLPISHETVLMGSDRPEYCYPTSKGDNFSIAISSKSEKETKRLFSALSAGGEVKVPLERAFWGAFFGMFIDRFGIQWLINYEAEHFLTK